MLNIITYSLRDLCIFHADLLLCYLSVKDELGILIFWGGKENFLANFVLIVGQLARQLYESMRKEAACLRIQKDLRMFFARKAYKKLCSSAVSIQTGMRGMAARKELCFRRQTRAAIVIQVKQFY